MGAVNIPRTVRLASLLDEWEEYAATAHEAHTTGKARGPITGFKYLDEELGHALQPGVHVLNGGPGSGKTAFASQLAATCGTPALFVSCEMPLLELFRRHVARQTGTFLKRLKSGEFSPAVSLALAQETAAALPFLTLMDATLAPAKPEHIREMAEISRGESPHVLIVIDSIQSWAESVGTGGDEYTSLNAAIASLRAIAHQVQCPVLILSERNRASADKGGLASGAGSRKIEYGAESVIDLNKVAEASVGGVDPIDLKLQKNRHGTPGRTFRICFTGATQSFTERA